MYNVDPCSLSLVNCILWGNANDQIRNDENANATVSYSIMQGGYSGTGNLNQDPLFVDAAGGNLRLQQCSPAINAGSNAALPQGTTTDLDEKPRIVHNTVDMGALEFRITYPISPIQMKMVLAMCATQMTMAMVLLMQQTVSFGWYQMAVRLSLHRC
jgi:hypothetical protein